MTSERHHSDFLQTICVTCGYKCIIHKSDVPNCGTCYFRDYIVKPMLAQYAPDAVLDFVAHSGNFVVNAISDGCRRHIILKPPAAWHTPAFIEMSAGIRANCYAQIRKLLNPQYRFDWKRHGELDDRTG